MKRVPKMRVVATSRPFGAMPGLNDGFDHRLMQPLDSTEVEAFTERFCNVCHPGNPEDKSLMKERVLDARNHSTGVASMVENPLLLTMLLFISRTRPLPDKRHELYEACIDNLLKNLPARYSEKGVARTQYHFRPDDPQERVRVAAKLAFELQSKGYKNQDEGRAIVMTRQELIAFLPGDWGLSNKYNFLNWLAERAGLLNDRSDETYNFAHLSFQEYLCALHLSYHEEGGAARKAAFERYATQGVWWETLRLWAAIENAKDPNRVDALSQEWFERKGWRPWQEDGAEDGDDPFWLAGAFFADGLGTEACFEAWAINAIARVVEFRLEVQRRVANIWSGSRQDQRWARLQELINQIDSKTSWSSLLRLDCWADECGFKAQFENTQSLSMNAFQSRFGEVQSLECLAASRAWAGSSPLWSGGESEWLLLRCWPSQRFRVAARVQAAFVSGLKFDQMANLRLNLCLQDGLASDFASDLARYLDRYLASDLVRNLASDLARYLASDLARYLARYFASDLVRDFASNLAGYLASDLARYLASDLARELDRYFASDLASDLARYLASDLARYLASDFGQKKIVRFARSFSESHNLYLSRESYDWSLSELRSFGWISPLVYLANLKDEAQHPLVRLFQIAGRIHYTKEDKVILIKHINSLDPDIDPLWPRLARHLAGLRSEDDRSFLENIAKDPTYGKSDRDERLQWGLQMFVRGDILLEDNKTIMTLDEFCQKFKLPVPDLLEDMPEPLKINFKFGE